MHQLQQIRNITQNRATPFYYYDMVLLDETLKRLQDASSMYNYKVHYALKANANDEILNLVNSYGFGVDCVSGNEIRKGIHSGFAPKHIVFAGVGKTDNEINYALENEIFSINCESFEEIEVINELAAAKNKVARIAVRINPNIDAKTHKHITTGKEENKFGIDATQIYKIISIVKNLNNVELKGLHFHIGSQILDFEPYIELCEVANELISMAISEGVDIQHLNLGGGLGIDYHNPDTNSIPDFHSFFGVINQKLDIPQNIEVHFELGRSIVGNCGNLVTKVLFNKSGSTKNFLIVDAGMTELLRPALYDAYHKVQTLHLSSTTEKYDVVGPICETTDSFASNVLLPKSKRGDLLIIRSVGAYGEVMSLGYNLRQKTKSVYGTIHNKLQTA